MGKAFHKSYLHRPPVPTCKQPHASSLDKANPDRNVLSHICTKPCTPTWLLKPYLPTHSKGQEGERENGKLSARCPPQCPGRRVPTCTQRQNQDQRPACFPASTWSGIRDAQANTAQVLGLWRQRHRPWRSAFPSKQRPCGQVGSGQ